MHNAYRARGGEYEVYKSEMELLREYGHRVIPYERTNDEIGAAISVALAPLKAIWNSAAYRQVSALIDKERPDVLHVHNTWVLVSPAIYWAAHRRGIPIVQTLHNYRLYCPAATFSRDRAPCELCKEKFFPYPAIRYRCYRSSLVETSVLASTLAFHRAAGTWDLISTFVTPTEFSRAKFIEAGLSPERIVTKPHFLRYEPSNATPALDADVNKYAIFVGRLAPEKGIDVLLNAWSRYDPGINLVIVGDGALREDVETAVATHDHIHYAGHQNRASVLAFLRDAEMLIFPSTVYESFGLTAIEAYAAGTPVVGSDIGTMQSIVQHGITGRLFENKDARDLADQVRWLVDRPNALEEYGKRARAEFESKYTPEQNYKTLKNIYSSVI